MRFLVDANLSPRVASRLRSAGHDVTHVSDEGLLTADDVTILTHASRGGWIMISAEADFATLLAVGGRSEPSLILLRSADRLTPDQQADLPSEDGQTEHQISGPDPLPFERASTGRGGA